MELKRDKQIEEMNKLEEIAKILYEANGDSYDTTYQHDCEILAEVIYNAGYRKASDVAEEIFAEIDDFQRTLRHIFLDMCGGNDYNTLNLLQIDSAIEALFDSRIAELKKKYTEEKMK